MAIIPDSSPLRVHSAALSDTGKHRGNNEDAYIADPALGLFAVADGMGGHAGGEVASQLAIALLKEAAARAPDAAYLQSPSVAHRRALLGWLAQTVEAINEALLERARQDRKLHGMGCTLDVALVRAGGLFLAHVGDSRTYLLRGGVLRQVTEDHTLGQGLLSAGVLSAEDVARHPQRNVLTRALGPFPAVQVDTSFLELAAGDLFLLCSDGLHGEVSDEGIQRLLLGARERAAPPLVQAALDGGGRDNVTVVVLGVAQCPAERPSLIGSQRARDALAQSPLFRRLTEAELLRVQKIAVVQEVAAGAAVVGPDLPADALYVVVDGELSVHREEVSVGVLRCGDPFGSMALVEAPSDVVVRAETPARLLSFPLAEVRELFVTDPVLAAKLARGALERTAERLARVSATLARYRKAAKALAALG